MDISKVLNIKENNNIADIYISGVIGYPANWQFDYSDIVSSKEDLEKEIKALENINKDLNRINIHIDSPGGSVSHALKMFYILDEHKAEKHTIYEGISASAATIVGSVSKLENITIPSYVSILVHEALFESYEAYTVSKLEKEANDLKKINRQLATIYSKLNSKSIEENLQLMSLNNGEGLLMTADEAKQNGFVGNIKQVHEKMSAFNQQKYLNWYPEHVNKLISINTNINKMGLFSNKKQFQSVETDKGKLVFQKIEKGADGEIIDSDEIVNGMFNLGEKSITIENNKITNIVVKDAVAISIENLTSQVEALKNELKAKDEKINGMSAQLDELIEEAGTEISSIKEALNKAKLTVSDVKIPKADTSNNPVNVGVVEDSVYAKQKRLNEVIKQKQSKK